MTSAVFFVSVEGTPTAVFPFDLGTMSPHTCSAFAEVGGHGAADYEYMLECREATVPPQAIERLKKILTAPNYGYELEVIDPPNAVLAYRVRFAKLNNGR